MSIALQPAQSVHCEAIVTLLAELGYVATYDAVEQAISNPAPGTAIIVAMDATQVVGVMSLLFFYYFPLQQQICRVTAIVVTAEHRGQGIGQQLLAAAAQAAKQQSCAQLEVTTGLQRVATQQFYQTAGFVQSSFRYVLTL